MTEEELLATVHAAPDDDEPRLVYADWLMQQGGARAARGEFINLQIEATRGPFDRAAELLEQAQRLLRDDWLPPLPGSFVWRRGFPWRWTGIDGATFVTHAARTFAVAPTVTALELDPPRPDVLREWLERVELARLRELTITPSSFRVSGLGDAGLRAVAASPHLAGLRELAVPRNSIGVSGVDALAPLARLESLSLAGNHVDFAACNILARRRWRRLDLSKNNGIGRGAVRALVAEPQPMLEWLALEGCPIDAKGIRALVRSPHLRALRWLSVTAEALPRRLLEALRARFPDVRVT